MDDRSFSLYWFSLLTNDWFVTSANYTSDNYARNMPGNINNQKLNRDISRRNEFIKYN